MVHVWILRFHADPHHPIVRLVVHKVSSIHVETLEEAAFLTGFLGGVHLIEGFGLWMKQRWAEYLCIISTCVFVIVYRSGLTKGTGVLSGARRIDVTMSITRIPL